MRNLFSIGKFTRQRPPDFVSAPAATLSLSSLIERLHQSARSYPLIIYHHLNSLKAFSKKKSSGLCFTMITRFSCWCNFFHSRWCCVEMRSDSQQWCHFSGMRKQSLIRIAIAVIRCPSRNKSVESFEDWMSLAWGDERATTSLLEIFGDFLTWAQSFLIFLLLLKVFWPCFAILTLFLLLRTVFCWGIVDSFSMIDEASIKRIYFHRLLSWFHSKHYCMW